MNKPIRIGILGLGRIGKMHARNLAAMDEFRLECAADPFLDEKTEQEMATLGLTRCSKNPEDVFSDPAVDAVLICSTTDTHADFIIRAAKAGKDIFCEKPIDHNVQRITEALRAVEQASVILQVGFMRRFDRHHGAVKRLLDEGAVGKLEVLKITSRDPEPPSMKYIGESGGIFIDSMIHDFDMARFLSGSEVVSVFATGTAVSDPEIAAQGDFGSAHAVLRFASGALGILEVSRRSSFGHDQRVEVLGSKGCAMDTNEYENNVRLFTTDGNRGARVPYFFIERYQEAYFVELRDFAKAVVNRTQPPVTGYDGLQAVLVAEAAARSAKTGKTELVERVTL